MNPKILYDLYIMKGYTIRGVADRLGVTHYQVYSQLIKNKIPRHRRVMRKAYGQARPYVNKYFLKKVDGFYYPLRGGEDMDTNITLTVHDEDGVLIYKRESGLVEVIEQCLGDVERLVKKLEEKAEMEALDAEDRTAEELRNESIEQNIDRERIEEGEQERNWDYASGEPPAKELPF